MNDMIENKAYSTLAKALIALWAGLIAFVVMLLLFVSRNFQYINKFEFAISNFILFIIAICSVAAIVGLYYWKKDRVDSLFSKAPKKLIVILSVALFAVQAYVFYNIFFWTGWDVWLIVDVSNQIAGGATEIEVFNDYFCKYPNNLLLTWLLSSIFKINSALGVSGIYSQLYIVVLLQSALACVAGYMLFFIVKDIVKNPVIPYIAWLIFVFNVALNPWLTITYSDAITLVIPIAVLRLYQLTANGRFIYLKWAVIGFITYFGYKIKPQVIIVALAIGIVQLMRLVFNKEFVKEKSSRIKSAVSVASFASAVIVCALFTNAVMYSLPVETNDDAAFGIPHFFMMGLNTETDGMYNQDDVNFSESFESAEERSENNWRVAKERLQNMGIGGMLKHLVTKCLVNYGDGTFAWGNEGNFYFSVPEEPNTFSAPLLRSLYYKYTGDNYQVFATLEQFLWISVLVGCCGVFLKIRKKGRIDNVLLIAVISLIGITLFQTIFEARARYLFNYSPFFIFVSALGWLEIVRLCTEKTKTVYRKIIKQKGAKEQ